MRLLTLFFLPVCLWSQQIDVQWNWQGIEKLHVGDMLKRVPKAIGHTRCHFPISPGTSAGVVNAGFDFVLDMRCLKILVFPLAQA